MLKKIVGSHWNKFCFTPKHMLFHIEIDFASHRFCIFTIFKSLLYFYNLNIFLKYFLDKPKNENRRLLKWGVRKDIPVNNCWKSKTTWSERTSYKMLHVVYQEEVTYSKWNRTKPNVIRQSFGPQIRSCINQTNGLKLLGLKLKDQIFFLREFDTNT